MQDPLFDALNNYKALINNNVAMRDVIKEWDRSILISCNDTQDLYSATFSNSHLEEIQKVSLSSDEEDIQISGTRENLINIFNGNLPPAKALLEGKISAFASAQDQIKLDSILLVLWG